MYRSQLEAWARSEARVSSVECGIACYSLASELILAAFIPMSVEAAPRAVELLGEASGRESCTWSGVLLCWRSLGGKRESL